MTREQERDRSARDQSSVEKRVKEDKDEVKPGQVKKKRRRDEEMR